VDISGFKLLDNDNSHTKYAIPATTVLPVGGFYVANQAQFGFELDSIDSVRLYAADGTTVIDSFSWLEHSSTTFGRCPDATGSFITTVAPTKGAANSCPTYAAWPGGTAIQTADGSGVFGGNLSGLVDEASGTAAPGVLWGVRNGAGTTPGAALFRLVWNGTIWT